MSSWSGTADKGRPLTVLDGFPIQGRVGTLKEWPCPALFIAYLLPSGRRYGHGSCARSHCPDSSDRRHLPLGTGTPPLPGRHRHHAGAEPTTDLPPVRLGA